MLTRFFSIRYAARPASPRRSWCGTSISRSAVNSISGTP